MQNPYAHSSGPAPGTPEEQKLADYELAIGPKVEFYLPKFEKFDAGGSKLGWHWPAFFVTSPWFIYRKMWGWGLGNLAYFWGMLTIVAPIAMAFAAAAAGKDHAAAAVGAVGLGIAVLLLIPAFLLPMFANALYWKHANKVIRNMPRNIAQDPAKRAARIARNGGTGAGPMIAVLAGGAFFFVAFAGIIAAISIPAYQDYTIRAQVAEGINLTGVPKAAVAEFYAQNGSWPADGAAAGLTGELRGKYVESVTIDNGSVIVTYGGESNQNIRGKRLVVAPGLTDREDIEWTCGDAASSAGVTEGPGPRGSELPAKYLPVACRAP